MGIAIKFYQDKVEIKHKSLELGRPYFEDADFVEILIPGDSFNIVKRKATAKDIEKYRQSYDKYKAGLEQSESGTPLEQWARLTRSQVANYKQLNFTTVEQVAEMSESSARNVGMGAAKDRVAAQAFLTQATDSALVQQQAETIERLDADNDELKRQLKELAGRLDAPKEAASRSPRKGK